MKKRLAIVCSTDYKQYPLGGMMSYIVDLLPYLSDDYEITLWGVSVNKRTESEIEIRGVKYPLTQTT